MDIQYGTIEAMSSRAFRCSLCGSGQFRSVSVPRVDGSRYPTCFFECAGCSVMFVDPSAFNANEAGPPRSRGPQLPAATYEPELSTYGGSPRGKD